MGFECSVLRGRYIIEPMPYKDPERQREYQRQWMAARREEWIQEHGPCVDCGSWDDLEIDHADHTKKVISPSRVWSWTEARRAEELSKCVARCHGCHMGKTNTEGSRARGSRIGNSVLTEKQVATARLRYAQGGITFRELGEMFGVKGDTVRVAVRKGWGHVSVSSVPTSLV